VSGEDPSVELTKAAAEGATSGAISALIAPVSAFLGALLGEPTEQLGGWAGDILAFKRWKSRVRMLQRAEAYLEVAGLSASEVPLPVLVPLLEGGANEDDESMSDRWAALLANAAAAPDAVPPGFPAILAELSPTEAALLDAIFEAAHTGPAESWESQLVEVRGLSMGLDDGELFLATDNLLRHRLCLAQQVNYPGTISEDPSKVVLTPLGRAFVTQCRAPTNA
jgi:hypothetical protein